MKNLAKKLLLIAVIGTAIISCGKQDPLIGKWKMEGVGTVDTANSQGNIVGYAMLTIMANGAEFEFTGDGNFSISNQGKSYAAGSYVLSSDGKILTLKSNDTEEVYELTKKSESEISIKSVKDASVITLKR